MSRKKLHGKVISLKTPMSAVVSVETTKIHPRYKKRYKATKKYMAHYVGSTLEVGNAVTIEETSPISKRKTWIVIIPKEEK